jgi:plastocyanin
LFALSVAVLALAACGDDGGDDGGSSSATVPPGALVVVAEDSLRWDQSDYAATATGGAITIAGENDSSLYHNLYVVSAEGQKSTNFLDLPTGATALDDFRVEPGNYQIVCLVPGHDSMKAALVVS